jgi:hypothetical protein
MTLNVIVWIGFIPAITKKIIFDAKLLSKTGAPSL